MEHLEEILAFYKKQGAPADQTALVACFVEIQKSCGGVIPGFIPARAAAYYGVKESFLLAVIRRIPRLRLADTHCLELCSGPNCSKRGKLAAYVEKNWGTKPQGFTVQYVPCMRNCGKGPNLRWDGTLYSGADEALLQQLLPAAKNTEKRSKQQ